MFTPWKRAKAVIGTFFFREQVVNHLLTALVAGLFL